MSDTRLTKEERERRLQQIERFYGPDLSEYTKEKLLSGEPMSRGDFRKAGYEPPEWMTPPEKRTPQKQQHRTDSEEEPDTRELPDEKSEEGDGDETISGNPKTVWIWHSEHSETTCDDCSSLDGKVFENEGDLPDCPVHPNCNCFIEEREIDGKGNTVGSRKYENKVSAQSEEKKEKNKDNFFADMIKNINEPGNKDRLMEAIKDREKAMNIIEAISNIEPKNNDAKFNTSINEIKEALYAKHGLSPEHIAKNIKDVENFIGKIGGIVDGIGTKTGAISEGTLQGLVNYQYALDSGKPWDQLKVEKLIKDYAQEFLKYKGCEEVKVKFDNIKGINEYARYTPETDTITFDANKIFKLEPRNRTAGIIASIAAHEVQHAHDTKRYMEEIQKYGKVKDPDLRYIYFSRHGSAVIGGGSESYHQQPAERSAEPVEKKTREEADGILNISGFK